VTSADRETLVFCRFCIAGFVLTLGTAVNDSFPEEEDGDAPEGLVLDDVVSAVVRAEVEVAASADAHEASASVVLISEVSSSSDSVRSMILEYFLPLPAGSATFGGQSGNGPHFGQGRIAPALHRCGVSLPSTGHSGWCWTEDESAKPDNQCRKY
jgi:hypothetical protein